MAHRHIYRTITRKKPYNTQLQDDLEFVLPMSKHLPFLPLLYITDVCTMLSVLIGNIYFVYIVSLCNYDYKLFVYIYIFLPRLLFWKLLTAVEVHGLSKIPRIACCLII